MTVKFGLGVGLDPPFDHPSKVKNMNLSYGDVYIPHVFSSLHTTDHKRSQGAGGALQLHPLQGVQLHPPGRHKMFRPIYIFARGGAEFGRGVPQVDTGL